MLQTPAPTDVAKLPLAPKNPLPYRDQLRAVRSLIDGHQELLDAGGPITRIVLGPKWLFPTAVLIASPQGARDVLGRTDEIADRGGTTTAIQLRRLMGGNLLVLPHHEWLPRRRTLQPMFTKLRVRRYAGHMAAAAQTLVDGWSDGATVDLDTECRTLTLRALGRSVLGMDLDARADAIGQALRPAVSWIADRATRPLNLPQWVPTPGQQRARRGNSDAASARRRDPRRGAKRSRPGCATCAGIDRRGRSIKRANHFRTMRSATSWCCSSSPATTPRRPLSRTHFGRLGATPKSKTECSMRSAHSVTGR